MNRHEDKTVPCTRCKKPTHRLGTKLCDACWERRRHVSEEDDRAVQLGLRVVEILKEWDRPDGLGTCETMWELMDAARSLGLLAPRETEKKP